LFVFCIEHRRHICDGSADFRPQPMALRQPGRLVVGEPHPSRIVLPHQSLERQVDPDRLFGLHQRRAAFGVAEYQKFGRPQAFARFGCPGGVIDSRKYRDAAYSQRRFEPIHRFLRIEAA
jgi:hypothetical protein